MAEAPAGFTCCNLHYSGDWISDANWFIHPRIPAGTPARILEYGDFRVAVDINGRRLNLGLDYGRKQSLRSWARLMVVDSDPKETIATWPEAAQAAIAAGKVAIGMSKEQVIVSVGYPPAHATPSMDVAQWKYWHSTHDTYLVAWDESGHVKAVIAEPPVRRAVLFADPVETSAASPDGAAASAPVDLNDLKGLLPGK